ncbi:MAG: hypothetical protein E4G95_07285 [Bacteroidia bacterium]|nr:MAG: hypothetical protein E4G95_07285 [Bacteroidia bacterium]
MKRLTLLLSAIFMMGLVSAQSNNEEIDLIQSIFGMEKKAMVADFVQVDESASNAFWKLYDEYETARKDLGKKRIELLEKYADTFETMTSEQADTWLKEVMKQAASTDNLIDLYTKKIKKISDPVTALQFYHIENFILASIRLNILGEVPFIEK